MFFYVFVRYLDKVLALCPFTDMHWTMLTGSDVPQIDAGSGKFQDCDIIRALGQWLS